MNSIQYLLTAVALFLLGATGSLFFEHDSWKARSVAGWTALFASMIGVFSAFSAFTAQSIPSLTLFSLPTFGGLTMRMDALSAFLVALISLVGVASSLYFLAHAPLQTSTAFFTNLFLAGMLLVVSMDNAFFFLIFWEIMTLASYFLVISKDENADIRTGFIYFLVAHAGAALIMLAIFMLYFSTGSFDFSKIRQVSLAPAIKNLVFIFALLGFGAKAGMAPLHFWAPDTYAAAPSHASALMAAVMKKTAIYGFLRICIEVIGVDQWWWGLLVLAFGALSMLLGAFYALPETNVKRLLAYSSIENVGIILMGVGIGMSGIVFDHPVLATLGFLAALYHTLNHAFFKSLLFLSTGLVIDQVKTTHLNQMGGLSRKMPLTALAFLIGVLSVAALPPFNGFASEWFTYQGFFSAAQTDTFVMRVFAPLCAALMALSGAIAVIVYIKAYSAAFSGPERNPRVSAARQTGGAGLYSILYLAAGCIFLGAGAPLIIPYVNMAAQSLSKTPPVQFAQAGSVFPADIHQAILSPPLVLLLLIGLLIIPLLLVGIFGRRRINARTNVEPWSCGYGYARSMSINASSYYQPVKVNFQPIFWLRTLWDKPARWWQHFSQKGVRQVSLAEPVVETFVTQPTSFLVEKASQWIQTLQMGDIRVYCLYIIITLAVLLIAIFGRSGL